MDSLRNFLVNFPFKNNPGWNGAILEGLLFYCFFFIL